VGESGGLKGQQRKRAKDNPIISIPERREKEETF
jgi:hypothetical protein